MLASRLLEEPTSRLLEEPASRRLEEPGEEKAGCRKGLVEAEALACLGPTAVLAAAVLAAAAFFPPPAPGVRFRFRVAIRGGAGDAAGVGASWIEAGVGVNYNGRFVWTSGSGDGSCTQAYTK